MHSAVVLDAVTHAANNSPEVVQLTGGVTSTVMRRDSSFLPQHSSGTAASLKPKRCPKRKAPPPVCSPSSVSSDTQSIICERTRRQDRATACKLQSAKRRKTDEDALAAAVASTAARLALPACQLPAEARLAALRERVRLRSLAAADARQ